ncbi:hypothetical protein T492DRAFT_292773 [Pavlovales sp. CCMP2436]|nr:hypothetical protein T492DRAFT_292773 [Pavlovales sp. CCMP2436]
MRHRRPRALRWAYMGGAPQPSEGVSLCMGAGSVRGGKYTIRSLAVHAGAASAILVIADAGVELRVTSEFVLRPPSPLPPPPSPPPSPAPPIGACAQSYSLSSPANDGRSGNWSNASTWAVRVPTSSDGVTLCDGGFGRSATVILRSAMKQSAALKLAGNVELAILGAGSALMVKSSPPRAPPPPVQGRTHCVCDHR